MLYKNVVPDEAYRLLKEIMQDEKFNDFVLVGGTSLALRIGHRKSIDLDLFTKNDINVSDIDFYLKEKYNFIKKYEESNTLKGYIDGVFIDCIKYKYLNIENTEIGITGLTNKEIVELHTTDNYGKIIINNPTISIITLMIVNENLSFFSQIELTEENINSNEVLTVTFDDYIFTK